MRSRVLSMHGRTNACRAWCLPQRHFRFRTASDKLLAASTRSIRPRLPLFMRRHFSKPACIVSSQLHFCSSSLSFNALLPEAR